MLHYFTISASFVDTADKRVLAAQETITNTIGRDEIKSGWTRERQVIAREALGDLRVDHVHGRLRSVKQHVNKKEGQEFRKVRVELDECRLTHSVQKDGVWTPVDSAVNMVGSSIILTLDSKQEVTHRLVAKLAACKAGDVITIGAFAEKSKTGFTNHVVTVKNAAGEEIKAPEDYFRQVRDKTLAMEPKLRELGITDQRTINEQVKKIKEDFFFDMAGRIGSGMPEIVPTRSSDAAKAADSTTAAPAPAPAASAAAPDEAEEALW